MTASAIYEGTIRHRRFAVRAHEFRHRIALVYLDLEELDGLLDGRLVAGRPGLVRFRRADYLGDPHVGLADAVRTRVERADGQAARGPDPPAHAPAHVRALLQPGQLLLLLHATRAARAVVAEVTSTPSGERHAYVLARSGAGPVLCSELREGAARSPFMGMEQRYILRAAAPGATLAVHIESHELGALAFDATLALRRAPLPRPSSARVTARYPAATLRVLALIYGHALALKLEGLPLHPRPEVPA